ncbi:MAG TPA: alkaline phosphatase family protein, partial [Candidatus Tumulicola sp.]
MRRYLSFLSIAGLLTACGSPAAQSVGSSLVPHQTVRYASRPSPIKHIVIIMQENRSFDNLFYGFPGANTAVSGPGKDGTTYPLVEVPLTWRWDLRHDHLQFLEDYDHGKLDGYSNQIKKLIPGCAEPDNHPRCWKFYKSKNVQSMAYAYVDPAEIKP